MKSSTLFLLPFTLLGLFSCGGNEEDAHQVKLDKGTMVSTQKKDEVSGTSQLTLIPYSKLNSLIEEKGNFVLLIKGSDDLCECWHLFHENCLAPYIKYKHLLVYYMDLSSFEKEADHYGIKLYANHDTLAIFENGSLAAQQSNASDEKWGSDQPTFFAWMDKHVAKPSVYYVSLNQLESLYQGISPSGEKISRFGIYYGRDTCPDCSYINTHELKDYFLSYTRDTTPLYYFDFDLYRGAENYQQKKDEYGLSQSESNPYGYGKGAFPTLMSIIPSDGEKINTIDQMGVFYNESIKDGTIANSYFTSERINHPDAGIDGALDYCREINPNVLDGIKVTANNQKEALSPYTKPLINALLDAII